MSDNERKRMTANDDKWQHGTANDKTNENCTVHFKEWMIVILSVAKYETLFQRMDGCN